MSNFDTNLVQDTFTLQVGKTYSFSELFHDVLTDDPNAYDSGFAFITSPPTTGYTIGGIASEIDPTRTDYYYNIFGIPNPPNTAYADMSSGTLTVDSAEISSVELFGYVFTGHASGDSGYHNNLVIDFIFTINGDLFTDHADAVDFNSVKDGSYIAGTQYDALDGNDIVTLPDDQSAAMAAGFEPGHAFHGGAGNDTITGGSLADTIFGDAGDDIIVGAAGNDKIDGGLGNDFMIDSAGKDTYSGGENLAVAPDKAKEYDQVEFEGKASNYVLTDGNGVTVVKRVDADKVNWNVESVSFSDGGFYGAHTKIDNDTTYLHLAELAKDAYSDLSVAKDWTAISAQLLGLRPTGNNGADNYKMVDGAYECDGAVAQVYETVVETAGGNKNTLAIAFRGTDSAGDYRDYPDFQIHYDKFKPLIDAVNDYIAGDNGIDQVWVTATASVERWLRCFCSRTAMTPNFSVRRLDLLVLSYTPPPPT